MDGVTVEGGAEVLKMLDGLGRAEQAAFKKAAKRTTRAGLKPMHKAARAAAPKRSGRLAKAIKLRTWRNPQRGQVGHALYINPGRKRDDPSGAFYGGMIEGGYIANGTYVPGRHMIGNAYRQYARSAQETVARALLAEADKIIKA